MMHDDTSRHRFSVYGHMTFILHTMAGSIQREHWSIIIILPSSSFRHTVASVQLNHYD